MRVLLVSNGSNQRLSATSQSFTPGGPIVGHRHRRSQSTKEEEHQQSLGELEVQGHANAVVLHDARGADAPVGLFEVVAGPTLQVVLARVAPELIGLHVDFAVLNHLCAGDIEEHVRRVNALKKARRLLHQDS